MYFMFNNSSRSITSGATAPIYNGTGLLYNNVPFDARTIPPGYYSLSNFMIRCELGEFHFTANDLMEMNIDPLQINVQTI